MSGMTPNVTRTGTGWYKVSLSSEDSEGGVSFSTSFQTAKQAHAFLVSLGFASHSTLSVENEPKIDREIVQMMRENRAIGI